jgi:uncharacterized membrane protein
MLVEILLVGLVVVLVLAVTIYVITSSVDLIIYFVQCWRNALHPKTFPYQHLRDPNAMYIYGKKVAPP